MGEFQKTDTTKSPLLKPVIQRSYTSAGGFDLTPPKQEPEPAGKGEVKEKTATSGTEGPGKLQEPAPAPTAGAGTAAGDTTKPFTFEEETGSASDIKDGEQGPGLSIPTGSARTFANTIGNIIQLYLPKATYGYVKIDMTNVRMNVEKGNLTGNWIEAFEKINKEAEESLKIPDDVMKMWKAAFQHYLEYKQLAFANPETEFWVATAVLLGDQGMRTYSLKKTMEGYMEEALVACGMIVKKSFSKPREPEVNNNQKIGDKDEHGKAA